MAVRRAMRRCGAQPAARGHGGAEVLLRVWRAAEARVGAGRGAQDRHHRLLRPDRVDVADRYDPEAVRAGVTRYFAALSHVLERHGGTVAMFIGDAVMAVF